MAPDLGIAALVISGRGIGLDLAASGDHGGRQEGELTDCTFLDR